LRTKLDRLIHSIEMDQENRLLREELRTRPGFGGLIGLAPRMQRVYKLIQKVGQHNYPVLILGESGTGKELVASALHRQSARAHRPFIKINCAAIPGHLIEDELFGHARGAFTDAKVAKPGLFEEADGGTLFLDEIGDMEYPLQSRLLRVLEDGRVRRIGDTRDRQVDVRVIAATNRDLEKSIREGTYREDLYFRLAHLPLSVPPLRERRGDVRLLFDGFLERFARQHRMRSRRVDAEVYPLLEAYAWPGNVRELRNLSERLVVFGGDPITPDQLPSSFFVPARTLETGLLRLPEAFPVVPLRDVKSRCEREYIEAVLHRTRWNFSAAARLLDVQRTYLHQKVKVLGIRRPGGAEE
jgi:DNA-binding NtrC family response regulator